MGAGSGQREWDMIVERRTAVVRPGCVDKVIALLREHTNGHASIARPIVGSLNRVTLEMHFENMAARTMFLRSWESRPEHPLFQAKWDEAVLDDSLELWEVV
jgi:hypothetical protein